MVRGCNGGAAIQAAGEVLTLQQELDEFADVTGVKTNVIVQLRDALVIAQEKARVLSEDCRRRGHRESYPWKTNWVVVNQALTASKKLYQ